MPKTTQLKTLSGNTEPRISCPVKQSSTYKRAQPSEPGRGDVPTIPEESNRERCSDNQSDGTRREEGWEAMHVHLEKRVNEDSRAK